MTDVELNEDGTPKEVPSEDVSLPKAEYDKLVEELAQKSQAASNLVSEVKEIREKKQLAESEKATLEAKLKEVDDLKNLDPKELTSEKIDSIINERLNESLSKKNAEERTKNQESAFTKFIETHKEFDESNDTGGIKLGALKKKLSMFNLDSQKSVEDFSGIFENARLLLKKEESIVKDTIINPNSHTSSNETSTLPAEILEDNLTSIEQKIIDRSFGGDTKRYLEQKSKRPDYVETLLKWVQ